MEINSRCVPSPGIGLVIHYMLDTNACIHVITGRVPSVRERLQAIPPEQIGVSAVVVAALQFGISMATPSRRETNQQALDRFLEMVVVEDWPRRGCRPVRRAASSSAQIGPTDRGQRSADRLPCPASPAGACHPEPAGVRTVAGSKCGGLVRLQLWCLDGISGIQVPSQKKLSRA
jgi:predicted nucleic acid-binding protein